MTREEILEKVNQKIDLYENGVSKLRVLKNNKEFAQIEAELEKGSKFPDITLHSNDVQTLLVLLIAVTFSVLDELEDDSIDTYIKVLKRADKDLRTKRR